MHSYFSGIESLRARLRVADALQLIRVIQPLSAVALYAILYYTEFHRWAFWLNDLLPSASHCERAHKRIDGK